MNCHDVNAKLADLLFEEKPETLIAKDESKDRKSVV